ncbi:MAG TPA: Flp pilus assembly protein CpaB [Chloroflexota bacterium]
MVAATLTPARALRRPRRTDPRALIGVFLTLAALAGSVSFWVGSSEARPVLIATRDLPVGATLRPADLAVAYVRMEDNLYRAALPADALEGLVGRQLGEPLHAQQVLAREQVAERVGLGPDQVAMTIPAKPDSAVDGRLRPGDAVQVLVTVVDKARAEAHARLVLERVQVYSVGREQAFSSSTNADAEGFAHAAINSVTLAVTPQQARLLAEARRTGELDVVLLPATAPPQSVPPVARQ